MSLDPTNDGILFADFKVEGDRLVRRTAQPSRRPILEFVKQIRTAGDVLRPLSFMGWELSIPENDYFPLLQKYPELNSQDAELRTRAWKKFMASSEAEQYRVHHRKRRWQS